MHWQSTWSLKGIIFMMMGLFICQNASSQQIDSSLLVSWKEAKKLQRGSIIVFWIDAPPFIWRDESGILKGIEYELILGYQTYVKKVYQIDLTIYWVRQETFTNLYDKIKLSNKQASFGVGGISITEVRRKEVGFSPSYMPDITVMISSEKVPIVQNIEDFMTFSSSLTAITVANSTFEQDLLKLKKTGNLSFKIDYVHNSKRILSEIQKRDNAFGIIDLATYLDAIKRNSISAINRQNLFPKIRSGFGLIYPLRSDWGDSMQEYFLSEVSSDKLEDIVSAYLNLDLYKFTESLTDPYESQLALLIKEKEIQSRHLKEEVLLRNMGFIFSFITVTFLVFIFRLYNKSENLLKKVKQQSQNIELQNRELEIKNKKLEDFTFANAHKLRAPVATILGLIQLFDYDKEEDKEKIIKQIKQSALTLDVETKAIRYRLEEDVRPV